jgi:hypothetical protein
MLDRTAQIFVYLESRPVGGRNSDLRHGPKGYMRLQVPCVENFKTVECTAKTLGEGDYLLSVARVAAPTRDSSGRILACF